MKKRKIGFMLFTLACIIAIGVCSIVNLAVNGEISWASYPLASVAFAWVFLSPFFMQKHGALISLCIFTLTSLPFLYILSRLTPVTDWFNPVGLPTAVTGIIVGWLLLILFRFTRINIWYKAALAVLLLGIVARNVIMYFAGAYAGVDAFELDGIINIFACLVLSIVLGIIGYGKSKV